MSVILSVLVNPKKLLNTFMVTSFESVVTGITVYLRHRAMLIS